MYKGDKATPSDEEPVLVARMCSLVSFFGVRNEISSVRIGGHFIVPNIPANRPRQESFRVVPPNFSRSQVDPIIICFILAYRSLVWT